MWICRIYNGWTQHEDVKILVSREALSRESVSQGSGSCKVAVWVELLLYKCILIRDSWHPITWVFCLIFNFILLIFLFLQPKDICINVLKCINFLSEFLTYDVTIISMLTIFLISIVSMTSLRSLRSRTLFKRLSIRVNFYNYSCFSWV